MSRGRLSARLARIEANRAEAEALGAEIIAMIEQLAADGADLTDIAEFLDQATAKDPP